jgi:hypothetical protein
MSFRQNPKNYTYLLMREQENTNLFKRLKNVKGSIDNKTPLRPKHLQRRRHVSNQLRFRKRDIQQANKQLYSKMMRIIHRRQTKSLSEEPVGSLNYEKRRKEINDINHKNFQFMKTLQKAKPSVPIVTEWMSHAD